MQERSVRLVAVFAVLAMIVTPLAVISYESDDSDAESVDYTRYYYDQLGVAGKWIYDQVVDTANFKYTFTKQFSIASDLHYTETDFSTIDNKVKKEIQKGIDALSVEQPTEIYWLSLSYTISTNSIGTPVTKINVTVTFNEADYNTFGTVKSTADTQINTALSDIKSTLGTGDRTSKIKIIHDKLCNDLVYDKGDETKSGQVRSVYTALVGDKHVVCEGYAKAFKAICDNNNIPCLILTGDAGTTGTYGAHMWNYVMLENECWYLMDITWDDQSTITYDYYLAGSETIGFNSTKVGTSHDPTRGESSVVTGYGLTVPSLSNTASSDPSYIVTFMNESEVFTKVAVKQNEKMAALTEKPTKEGYYFLRWCKDPGLTEAWNWDTPVTENMSLYAEFTANPVRINLVDGDKLSYIYVEKNVPTKLTELATPSSEGKTFKGWNTAKDGTGIYYTTNDTVTLSDDMNLYAIWDEPSNDPVMNTINQINEFLAGESVIKGVSNTVLAIAVCSGVLLLIGFFLIRIKK